MKHAFQLTRDAGEYDVQMKSSMQRIVVKIGDWIQGVDDSRV